MNLSRASHDLASKISKPLNTWESEARKRRSDPSWEEAAREGRSTGREREADELAGLGGRFRSFSSSSPRDGYVSWRRGEKETKIGKEGGVARREEEGERVSSRTSLLLFSPSTTSSSTTTFPARHLLDFFNPTTRTSFTLRVEPLAERSRQPHQNSSNWTLLPFSLPPSSPSPPPPSLPLLPAQPPSNLPLKSPQPLLDSFLLSPSNSRRRSSASALPRLSQRPRSSAWPSSRSSPLLYTEIEVVGFRAMSKLFCARVSAIL